MKHTYSVEALSMDRWARLFTDTRDFCLGYLTCAQYDHPRLAMRLIRSDGKVVHELRADYEVCVGQIAGWPTPEQYEAAAKRALEKAARIFAANAKQEERRLNRISAQ